MEPTGPKLAGTSRQSRPATERRQTMRHRTHSPAYARLNVAPADAPDLSEILDISEDGMSIQTSLPLEVKRSLGLCLDLSETSASIVTTGQVVWSESSGRAGIRFAKLSGQSMDQLKEWLFVNILTAFDHAGAASADEDRWNSASKVLASSHTMPKGDFVSGTRVISDDDADAAEPEVLAGPGAMYSSATRGSFARERVTERERELESKQFDREAELQSIAERALTLTRATGAAIALSAENDREMICVASAGEDAPPVRSRLQVGSGFSGECVRTGRSLRCDDSETDDRVDREGCKSLGIRSLIAVPIRQGNKVAGLLEVFSPQPYAFNADDIGALQQLTGSILSTTGSTEKAPAPKVHVSTPTVPPSPPTARPVRAEKPPAAKPSAIDTERPVTVSKPASELGLSERGLTEPISIQPAATQAATIRLPASQVAPVHASATPARSTQPSVAKALFVAAIGTFIFALLWLIAPWVSSAMRSSGRTPSHAQAAPAAPPKSPALPANGLPASVTDLASLRKVAEQGDPAAQFSLGARYATGEEVKQDYTEAVRWFTLAAEQGHILAQATLGAYYWAGRGVPQDLTKAYYWSVLAQAGGDQASKYRVAVLASRMSRSQVLAAQQQANDWLNNFASHPPATP
jgi:putative methionine-R-sulfoxide reductase with GAF domain